jgi:type I restriction enzyme M protein
VKAGVVDAKDKSLESWIWDVVCWIRGAKDAPKYNGYIPPLIFTKRPYEVFARGCFSWGAGREGL